MLFGEDIPALSQSLELLIPVRVDLFRTKMDEVVPVERHFVPAIGQQKDLHIRQVPANIALIEIVKGRCGC